MQPTAQRKSVLPAATGEDTTDKKVYSLHITTSPRLCQILWGTAAGAAFLGMLGVIGGMEKDTIEFMTGIIWELIFLVIWIISLEQGGWI